MAGRFMAGLVLLAACSRSPSSSPAPPPEPAPEPQPEPARARDVRVTTLSTMETSVPGTRGEWGYAALVDIDGEKLLFDTGRDPQVVLHNLEVLGLSLADVDHVVLSHHHGDHTGGLAALRARFPGALATVHVGAGFAGKFRGDAGGARIETAERPAALLGHPYLMVTGPIARGFEERTVAAADLAVPDDQALVIDTTRGLVVIVGCAHAGVVNTLDAAQAMFPGRPLHALIGGLHLFEHTPSFGVAATLPEYLGIVAGRMRRADLGYLLGSHCTGIDAVDYLRREVMAGDRRRAVVDTTGNQLVIAPH